MTQYPTNPSSSAKLRVSKTNFLTEKNTPTPPLLPLKLSTFDYFFFFLHFSKLEEKRFFSFKYSLITRLLFCNYMPHPERKYFVWGWSDLILREAGHGRKIWNILIRFIQDRLVCVWPGRFFINRVREIVLGNIKLWNINQNSRCQGMTAWWRVMHRASIFL